MEIVSHTTLNSVPRLMALHLPVRVPTIGLDIIKPSRKTRSLQHPETFLVRYHCCGRFKSIKIITLVERARKLRNCQCQTCSAKQKRDTRKKKPLPFIAEKTEMDFFHQHWRP